MVWAVPHMFELYDKKKLLNHFPHERGHCPRAQRSAVVYTHAVMER